MKIKLVKTHGLVMWQALALGAVAGALFIYLTYRELKQTNVLIKMQPFKQDLPHDQ